MSVAEMGLKTVLLITKNMSLITLMINTLIADTGYFAALANPKDAYHQYALRPGKTLPYDLITTWPVIAETCLYLIEHISPVAQSLLLNQIANETIQVIDLNKGHAAKMGKLMQKYADLPMDLGPTPPRSFWQKN